MKDRKLATRYARALLSLLDPARAESADQFLDALRRAMLASPETRDLLLDPAVPAAERRRALRGLARQVGQPPVIEHFLAAVVDHNRTASLPSIAVVFHEERERRMGIVPAEITTARPLEPAQQARAREALERATGQTVRLSCKVEPGVLGGAVTRIGSKVYDGSLRSQLDRLRERMVEER
jgi:F-type H+-transporting ATPase subunit delta